MGDWPQGCGRRHCDFQMSQLEVPLSDSVLSYWGVYFSPIKSTGSTLPQTLHLKMDQLLLRLLLLLLFEAGSQAKSDLNSDSPAFTF